MRFGVAEAVDGKIQLVELDQLWGRDGALLQEHLLEAGRLEATFQFLETLFVKRLIQLQDPDEPHAIHDFRNLTGLTPTAYRPRSAEEQPRSGVRLWRLTLFYNAAAATVIL